MIKKLVTIVCFSSVSFIAAQPPDGPVHGTIYGTVVDRTGLPARGIGLLAMPLGVPLGTALPKAITDQNGKYHVAAPWWARYSIIADDEKAGYSLFATTPHDPKQIREVSITPENPKAEFNLRLPPRAGFLHVYLTNSKTGEKVADGRVSFFSKEDPDRLLFSAGCSSNRPILVRPDEDLLIHVTSPEFKEWEGSIGKGKRVRIASGSHIAFDIKLEPSS